jgi:hypothetical protein
MIRKAIFVIVVAFPVAAVGLVMLRWQLPVGPVVLGLSVVPVVGLMLAGRRLTAAVPDMVFGAIDTGLLVIPALLGGMAFGVAGAIAGSIIGDALTDAVAGFFEGGISEWLRKKGIEESREAVTSSLGKMSGCLQGAGLVLSLALAVGVRPAFA